MGQIITWARNFTTPCPQDACHTQNRYPLHLLASPVKSATQISSISPRSLCPKQAQSKQDRNPCCLALHSTTPQCINMRMKACNFCRASPIAGCLEWIFALLRRGADPRLPPADALAHVDLPSYTRRPTECVGQEGRHALNAGQDSPLPRTRPAVREGNTKGTVECSPLG